MGLTSDFAISLNGHCFVCLSTLKLEKLQDGSSGIRSSNSLQCLSRFLKLDRRKVFSGKAVPTHLVEKVNRARLMVDLCDDCAGLNNKFLLLFNQLEKIKMEVAAHLTSFRNKMLEAGEIDRRAIMLARLADTNRVDSNDTLEGKLEIAEVIRKDLVEKSFKKLTGHPPRIPLRRLTIDNIRKKKLGLQNAHPNSSDNQQLQSHPNANFDSSNTKWESEHMNVTSNEDGSHTYHSDIFQGQSVSNEGTEITKSPATIIYPSQESPSLRFPGYCVRIEPGKFKCSLCSKILGTQSSIFYHYQTAHLKLRFRCSICGKVFSRKGSLRTHQEGAHLGRLFKCQFCPRQFSCASNRRTHLKSSKCSKRNSITRSDASIESGHPANQNPFQESASSISNIKLETEHEHVDAISEEDGQDYVDDMPDEEKHPSQHDSLEVNKFETSSARYIRTKSGKFECRTCSKILAAYSSFNSHFRSKHSKIVLKCNICNKTFTQKTNLITHHESVHLKRRVSCKFCPKTFTSPANRSHHLRLGKCSGMNGPRRGLHKSGQPNQSHLQSLGIGNWFDCS